MNNTTKDIPVIKTMWVVSSFHKYKTRIKTVEVVAETEKTVTLKKYDDFTKKYGYPVKYKEKWNIKYFDSKTEAYKYAIRLQTNVTTILRKELMFAEENLETLVAILKRSADGGLE